MLSLMWIRGSLRRRAGRMLGLSAAIALVVMLTASLGAFFTASRSRMTREAVAAVAVDWQVQLATGADVTKALRTVSSAPGISAALPVGYADVTGFRATVAGGVQTTGSGTVLGLPPGYAATFPGTIRYLVGANDGVLLAQQTAANLHATVGTGVTILRPGQPPMQEKVSGIVDLPTADSLFQSVGAAPGSAPTAPPDNVMLLPAAEWNTVFAGTSGRGVTTQIHTQLSSALPSDPGAAFAQVVGRAKNLEAALAGAGLVGDNLAAQLDATRSDAIYAQLLFVFLGLPGVVVAMLLTLVVASWGRERRRADQALLRTRGASSSRILRLAAAEAVTTGLIGVVVGLAGAIVVGRVAFGTSSFGATTGQAIAWLVTASVAGLLTAGTAVVMPAWRDVHDFTVRATQLTVGRTRAPLWARWYLDAICLAAGGLVYWRAVRTGYQVVLAPEGVPTISVDTFTLLAPLLFWIGAALFTWRLGRAALVRGRGVLAKLVAPLGGPLSSVVAASMSRQRRALARGMVLTALAASFALSVAIFNTTYSAQAEVDARLTNGADVTASTTTLAGLPASLPDVARGLSGVAAAEPMQHRFAYVGNDLQDLYGIDPATIGNATSISNAYFAGGNAQQVLATLAAHPDGVLVSDETVHDFQLQPGDLIRLRLQSASDGAYHVVPFHYVGIAREFPTAPHDSFLVANATYVTQKTGTAAFQTLLVRTSGAPPAVAAELRSALGPASGATVQDIVTQRRITLSGLTAIDLAGLTRLELAFALVLAAAASGLVLALGLAERKRTFAIASALGARNRQLAAFVWSEAAFVGFAGLVLGGLAGWGIAEVIVKILTGVFDPPPEQLSIPWGYLALAGATAVAALAVGGAAMLRVTRRAGIEALRGA
jgi:putative ABC transport system permease protein